MIKEYRTILSEGNGEIVEKKSRFIGCVRHVESEDEANAFILEKKKQYYDARHNCYAYIIGEENPVMRFSDDGEPGGTAGKPILEVINGGNLTNVCIVVTRYFGGTLLGTGGLVRAYTDAAKECIANTVVMCSRLVYPVLIKTNYTDLGKLQYLLSNEKLEVVDSDYGEDVSLKIEVPFDDMERIEKLLIEATAARAAIQKGDAVFVVYENR